MDIHAISTGMMHPDLWVQKALKIHENIDYLHIREPAWNEADLIESLTAFEEHGGDTAKIIVNAKTSGYQKWQGKVHFPEPQITELHFSNGGISVHDAEKAKEAERKGAAYVMFGPVYAPFSKRGVKGKGLAALQEIVSAVSVPVVAVGGITPDRIEDLRTTGIRGVAVISAIFQQEDPMEALEQLRKRRNTNV